MLQPPTKDSGKKADELNSTFTSPKPAEYQPSGVFSRSRTSSSPISAPRLYEDSTIRTSPFASQGSYTRRVSPASHSPAIPAHFQTPPLSQPSSLQSSQNNGQHRSSQVVRFQEDVQGKSSDRVGNGTAWRPATPLPKFNLDSNEELNWSLWLTIWGFRTENLEVLTQFIKRKCADVKILTPSGNYIHVGVKTAADVDILLASNGYEFDRGAYMGIKRLEPSKRAEVQSLLGKRPLQINSPNTPPSGSGFQSKAEVNVSTPSVVLSPIGRIEEPQQNRSFFSKITEFVLGM